MDFLEKLSSLMEENGLNKHSLSAACQIPYTTIDGWYKRGCDGAKISTLIKLADFFQVELDYLVRPSITDKFYGKSVDDSLSPDERNIIGLYRLLNETGQSFILTSLQTCVGNPAMQKDDHNSVAV